MAKKTKIIWRPRAKRNLIAIKQHIAQDAPRTAIRYIRRLKDAVKVLERLPEVGGVIEELDDPQMREILFGDYRIIYRFDGRKVEILVVVHGARLIGPEFVERD